jgi:hypothetical protein
MLNLNPSQPRFRAFPRSTRIRPSSPAYTPFRLLLGSGTAFADFLVTRDRLGIRIVDIRDIRKDGRKLIAPEGHPNWYFRISKFSLPFLKHPSVPRTLCFRRPIPRGSGARTRSGSVHPPERIEFAPLIDTPHGPAKAEIRMMFIWTDRLRPVTTIVRMGRWKNDGRRSQQEHGAAGRYPRLLAAVTPRVRSNVRRSERP